MVPHPDDRVTRRASPWTRAGGIRPAINTIPIRTDPARRPSPRRLRRMVDQWLPLGHSSLLAKIIVLRHGGHKVPVIHRGSKHLRFRYISDKTGTTQLGEGKGEKRLALLNEVSSDTVDYECHPFEIHVMRDGRVERYRPDAVRQLVDGTIELIEVKRDERDLDDAEYREKLAVVAEIARLCGWRFRDMHLDEILGPRPDGNPRALPQRVHNVDALFGNRTMDLTRGEERVSGRVVSRGDPIEWGDLREQLAPTDPLRGDAAIERLLARGLLSTDLDVRFRPSTVLVPRRPFVGASGIRL